MRAPLLAATCWLLGCAPSDQAILIEAHRGAAGYWPQNSRAAVVGSLAADFDGLEVDLVLSKDGKPLLAHDPWLSPTHCTMASGEPLAEEVRIDEVRLNRLQERYRCGGLPDPDFPGAEVVAEPLLSYEALIALLFDGPPHQQVHLDVKVEAGWTPPAEDFAAAILDPWWAADLPQPLVMTANTVEAVQAFETHAQLADRDLKTWAVHPHAPAGSNSVAVGLAAERDSLLGKVDYLQIIEEAGADGIAVHWEVAERGQLLAVRAAGYEVALWTLNDADLLRRYRRWPVDVLITDYPGSTP